MYLLHDRILSYDLSLEYAFAIIKNKLDMRFFHSFYYVIIIIIVIVIFITLIH